MALKEIFHDILKVITTKYPERKIVIVLDSIDQLAPSDYSLDWVLDELPHRVKMLYSVKFTAMYISFFIRFLTGI